MISPAVPPDRSLLRTSFMSLHTDEELDKVLEISKQAGRQAGII